MRTFLISMILTCGTLASAVRADDVQDTTNITAVEEQVGTVSADGSYVLGEGGYWWRAGNAYVRESTLVTGSGYWYREGGCGCWRWYQPASYYKHTYRAVLIKKSSSFWTDLATLRARIDEDKLKAQAIAATFPAVASSYASASVYQAPRSYQTYNQYVQQYGAVDVNGAIQAYAQTARAVVDAGPAAADNLGAFVQGITDNQAEYALYKAKLDALQRFLDVPASTRTQTTVTSVNEAGSSTATTDTGVVAAPQADGAFVNFSRNILTPKCAGCHSAGKEFVAKFDVARWKTLTVPQKAKVWELISNDKDPEHRMPKGGAHGEQAGTPLTWQERLEFFKF